MWKQLLILLLFVPALCPGATMYPPEDWKDTPDPIADPEAIPGGQISVFGGQYPKSLNYYLDTNTFTFEVFLAMFDTLLTEHPITLDYQPGIAGRWSISDDKKTYTFWIDPRAKWSDGEPILAEDVQWTFDAIMNPKNLTGVHQVYFQTFERPEVLGPRQIRFTAKEVHWRNLMTLGAMNVLPKHAYEGMDFNKLNFEFPVISGPYKIKEIKEGISIALQRRYDWWKQGFPSVLNTANFDVMTFKVFADRNNAFESFLKGDIDLYPVYTSHIWVNKTRGVKFQKNWIIKQKVSNYLPLGFQGFPMNMRRFPFDDVRVRKAMALLLNRAKMNATLMYNQYFLHKSYYEDLYTPEHPCPNKPVPFDPAQARELLSEAGWKADPETGLLEKNGQPFRFRFLSRDESSNKFLAIYAEDLKDAGIQMEIDQKDWAAWTRDMENFNFDMTWAAWSAGTRKDPEGMWYSKEAERSGGFNYAGLKNERVDELIEEQKTVFDVDKQEAIVREIDQIVFDQHPYALLWNNDYVRLLYWNKFGVPDTVLSKYGDERSSYWYWWYDPDTAADLRDAMQHKDPLPEKQYDIQFDEHFSE